MPSRSWKQFVGGIKLAVSRGKGEGNEPPKISSVLVLHLHFSLSDLPLLFGSAVPHLIQCLLQGEADLG